MNVLIVGGADYSVAEVFEACRQVTATTSPRSSPNVELALHPNWSPTTGRRSNNSIGNLITRTSAQSPKQLGAGMQVTRKDIEI